MRQALDTAVGSTATDSLRARIAALLVLLLIPACDGRIFGGDDAPDDSDTEPTVSCEDGPSVGQEPLRRLTSAQYQNAVSDLFPGLDVEGIAAEFTADTKLGRFDSNGAVPVSELQFEQYQAAAELIATAAVTDLAALTGCAEADRACAETYLRRLARRAYRRPLNEGEFAELLAFYDEAAVAGHDVGLRLAIEHILQSPHFLYHVELGNPEQQVGSAIPLTQYEIASRLAFLFWNTIPDDELLDTADAERLASAADIEAQARRLLQSPRAANAVVGFHTQWLGLDALDAVEKDQELFPEFSPQLRRQLQTETARFAEYVVLQGDGSLATLFGGGFSFLTGGLFALYGVEDPGETAETFGGWRRVEFPPGQRAGLFTQAGFLAAQSHANQTSPVHRGKLIREAILCDTLAPPPPNVDDTPPEPDPNATTRERFAQHREDPACAGCHQLMDPLGLAFESYDAIGRFRTTEGENAIDTSGEIVGSDVEGAVADALELSSVLATSEQVQRCVAANWFQFALGRNPNGGDSCAMSDVYAQFAASDFNIRELLVAIATSDAFRYRLAEEK